MNYEKLAPHLVTVTLLGLAAYFQSAAFAYAAVAALAVNAAHEIYSRMLSMKEVKPGIPEEVKRAVQDLNARVATLEYGVKTRGF